MAEIVRLEDLQAEEIQRLLADTHRRLPEDQAAAAREAADRIGHLKQAFDTLQSLHDLGKAA
jgi:hypothetical protein